jgi:hypothetical protein
MNSRKRIPIGPPIGTIINIHTNSAERNAVLTAWPLWKLIGAGPIAAAPSVASAAALTSFASASSRKSVVSSGIGGGSSNCGFPHLWQNRASSGSFAPQVQKRFTFSVCHKPAVIRWKQCLH